MKQDGTTFNHGKIANIYIVYDINKSIDINNYPTLENYLFGAVRLTKNVDVDKYKYYDMDLDLIEKDLIQLVMKSVEM